MVTLSLDSVALLAGAESGSGFNVESSAAGGGGGGVFDFGGAEAGEASGSSGVAIGGTTTPIVTGSGTPGEGSAAGAVLAGAGSWTGRARRAAPEASVAAFMYISAGSDVSFILYET